MVSIPSPFGQVVAKPFEVRHTGSELKNLAKYLKSLEGETRVVMEHMGRYYEPIAQYLCEAGIFGNAVNPKLIKNYGNNSLRKVKTDKADSREIAKYALDNWTELRQYTSMDKTRYQQKVLNRPCSHLTADRTAQKNSLTAILDMTYPGANELFTSPARGGGTQKWVDFVRTFWHVDCVRGASLAAFTERYRKWSRKNKYNYSNDKAAQIYADAQEQIAVMPKDNLTKIIIRQSVDSLTTVFSTVEQLIAELGDVTRFARRSTVTAFADVDLGANQSGAYEAKSSRISKRGPPELRRTLVMDCLLKNRPQDNLVYQIYGQETIRRQAVSGLYNCRSPQIPAYLLWQSEGVFSFAGTAARG